MTDEKAVDSTSRGPPLSDEPLGALTLGGFLREVCARHGQREALVFHPSAADRSSGAATPRCGTRRSPWRGRWSRAA